jgi:adenylate cyclase
VIGPLRAAFAEEQVRGLELAAHVRLVALAVLSVWVGIENDFPEAWYPLASIVGFALIGVVPPALVRRGSGIKWLYLQPVLDFSLLTFIVLTPNPFDPDPFPAAMRLRLRNEFYLLPFLTVSLLSYSPRLVLWSGFVAVVVWATGVGWIIAQPETWATLEPSSWNSMTPEQKIAAFLDPHLVHLGFLIRQTVIILVVSGVLAAFVARSRQLVLRQVSAERERANLSRYFSPTLVDQLARSDEPLRTTSQQNVAVLFADLAGFTAIAAERSPASVITLLREYHKRTTRAVFAHGGTLDEYLGDGVMATFGTPRTGPSDATHALRCARSIVSSIDEWNRERERIREAPLHVRVGVHYGPVVLGNVGDEQLKFAVVGDTVNVASRLQELTRKLGAEVAISQDLIDAVRTETPAATELDSFEERGEHEIRGRGGTVRVWTPSHDH